MITYTISSTQTGIAMTHFDVMEDTPGAFVLSQFGYAPASGARLPPQSLSYQFWQTLARRVARRIS